MDKLQRVKDAIWYEYLSGGVYTYAQACDVLESMLPAKSALLKEGL
jgi:hypothetical protein